MSEAIPAPAAPALTLRPAEPGDAAALAELGRESFCAAFAHLYLPDDLNSFLDSAYDPQAITAEIASDDHFHCLAMEGGRLLGFCKMRHPGGYPGHSDAANPITLSQLYTRPEMTGRGLGAVLMDWAIGESRARGCDAIQLSVWSGNHGAQKFYARYGFAKIADIDFWVGSQRDDEYLFELRLLRD